MLALLAAGLPVAAYASDADTTTDAATAAAGAAASSAPAGEIIVSAERTHTTLQKATLSVTAVSADTLAKNNITEIGGLNGQVPGLVVASSNAGERNIAIRGIGLGTPENPQTQSGVSYHIDGVYIFNSIAANAAFIDVGQVEVLRGPQGTMYGQGSTGGTINVVSNQPTTDAVSGSADVGYGNYNYIKSDAMLNVPITDTLAVRGAVSYEKHDGYAHATQVPGNSSYSLSNANHLTGKASIKWTPTSDVSVLLSTIQYRGNDHAPEQKNVLDPDPDAREVTQDYPGRNYVRTQLYYGVIKYNMPGVTFTSTTSYQKLKSNQSWDGDGLDEELYLADAGAASGGATYDHIGLWQQKATSWTQEYNIASDTKGPFKWILGGVYLHSVNKTYINEFSGNPDSDAYNPQATALPADTAWDDPAVQTVYYGENSQVTRESYAFYGQGTYKLTDLLSFTAGVRYNHDKYSGMSDTLNGGATDQTSGAYLQPAPTVTHGGGQMTWKAALDYQITPENMVYVSYTRGYKPGGVNSNAAVNGSYVTLGNPDGVQGTIKNEVVDSFEIGSKNRFFGNKLTLNASAFYYLYKNMQFINDDPVLFAYGISNVPMAHIYGAEFEANYDVTPHLTLNGNLALEHGTFSDNYEALSGIASSAAQTAAGYGGTSGFYSNYYAAYLTRLGAYQDVKGNDVPTMPAVTGSGSAEWNGDVGPGQLLLRAQYTYRGKYNSDIFGEIKTPSYQTVNLFARYALKDTGLWVSATLTNLFNVNGISSRFTDPYGVTHQTFSTYIPPRQFIATIGFKF
ncbi:TonB-dependent receptor [Novosphingobium sp. 9]|uniref:TonB-dependent receptor n=1 Tax=Novosphingobium sp. 9 TaxID=2025349 RepID=UPI0021B6A076|nr:TonB-dependent receptor [Novosphingobium sp. 9]